MTEVSYSALLRHNRNFRHLWFGQLVSQLGDWFNSVAVYALLLDLTGGSATAVAWMMVVQFLPIAVIGPLAGIMVDRHDRRRIMIAADLARGVLILGLLLVRRPDQVWIAYVCMAAAVTATGFFEPARTATIPNITSREELMPANTLASASWSAMLAIGAALGGAVTAFVGRDAAFGFNSLSFFASAALIASTRIPAAHAAEAGRTIHRLADLNEGLRYVRSHRYVAALMSVKAGWGIAGGALLLLTMFAQREFPLASGAAAGIGLLFGARGIGAGLGGLLTKQFGHERQKLRRVLAPSYLVYGAFYLLLAVSPNIFVAALAVLVAHAAGAVLWVASTVLLQLEVPDQFRGRVFSAELALVTLIASAATYLTAYGLDELKLSARTAASLLGLLFIVPGVAWWLMEGRLSSLEAAHLARPGVVKAPSSDFLIGGE
jgi:MFS family permease